MAEGADAAGLQLLTTALASDALDRLGRRDQTLTSPIRPLRPGYRLVGRALPVSVVASDAIPDEPYAGEMRAIELLGPGDVAVYATGADVRAAVWGELFSLAARGRGALGAVLDGAIRDAEAVASLGFPVFCRGFSPLDTMGRAVVDEIGSDITCGGVRVSRGDCVVADEDGVVIVPEALVEEVVARIEEKVRGEDGARDHLLAGKSVREVWDAFGVF